VYGFFSYKRDRRHWSDKPTFQKKPKTCLVIPKKAALTTY
jgi:hypothetical protein